jgi:hypothetical protein
MLCSVLSAAKSGARAGCSGQVLGLFACIAPVCNVIASLGPGAPTWLMKGVVVITPGCIVHVQCTRFSRYSCFYIYKGASVSWIHR